MAEKIIVKSGNNAIASYDTMGKVSDGYHTFDELYNYRMLYNAGFFNELNRSHPEFDVHKSKRHADGELCFGSEDPYFIVMAQLPTGQISNHYPMADWDKFQIPEKENANKWDGHTPQDVAERLEKYVQTQLLVEHSRTSTSSPYPPMEALGLALDEALETIEKGNLCNTAEMGIIHLRLLEVRILYNQYVDSKTLKNGNN